MKSILLIGLGRFGVHVVDQLYEMGHQVMAIDQDEERVNNIIDKVTNGQIGDITNPDFLQSLDIPSYDLCIVTVGQDFKSSLITTALLKELGAKYVVSRAETDIHEKLLLKNGADEVIYPEREIARWTAIKYSEDKIYDYVELSEDHSITEVAVPDEWVNCSVKELNLRGKYGINLLAIKKNGSMNFTITPDTILEEGSTILVLTDFENLKKCFHI